jgi:hypothetical protein
MKPIPYTSAVRSIMYAQVCIELAFISKFQTYLGMKHCQDTKISKQAKIMPLDVIVVWNHH